MSGKLEFSFNSSKLAEFMLNKEVITIGRKEDNDVRIENLAVSGHQVIIPFLTSFKSRSHAAVSICFGGKPPLALLGRSFIPPNLERHW